jgi:arylsulfatase A-like enzyme
MAEINGDKTVIIGTDLIGVAGCEQPDRPSPDTIGGRGFTQPYGVFGRDNLRYIDDPSIEELYNLREDPKETANLASDPDHRETLAELRAKLVRLADRLTYSY